MQKGAIPFKDKNPKGMALLSKILVLYTPNREKFPVIMRKSLFLRNLLQQYHPLVKAEDVHHLQLSLL
jgi:hypothetical protein